MPTQGPAIDRKTRCDWALDEPLLMEYHDEEWGVPEHDDRKLFEFLVLEGAQAGLSWLTVLKKRENFRRAFDGFDPRIVAYYGSKDSARLLADRGIIRNRNKSWRPSEMRRRSSPFRTKSEVSTDTCGGSSAASPGRTIGGA